MTLAMIQASVAASVAASNSLAQQALTAAATGEGVAGASLASATAAARGDIATFQRDMFERKVFDPYLRFTSPEDEEAYRQREREREATIKAAMAKGTPEGTLEANRVSIEQLKDAGAHGADRSPDYATTMNSLVASGQQIKSAIAEPAQVKAVGAERLSEAARPSSDLEQAKAQLDPALLAAFGASVAPTAPSAEGHGLISTAARDSGAAPLLG